MNGQILELPYLNEDGIILGFNNKMYYFTSNDCAKNIYLNIGAEIDFEPLNPDNDHNIISKKKFRKYVQITKSNSKPLHKTINDIIITEDSNFKEYKIDECIKDFLVYGESTSKDEALNKLADLAQKVNANGVVDVRLSINYYATKSYCLYTYKGFLVKISKNVDNSKINPANYLDNNNNDNQSSKINIKKSFVIKQSPNLSKKNKIRFTLILFMLFFFPLWGQLIEKYSLIIPRSVIIPVGIFIFLFIIVSYININPHTSCAYIRKLSN
ncbi:MAG: hypothetical protein ACI4V7_03240 [Succinivibrionaceae bacterium]